MQGVLTSFQKQIRSLFNSPATYIAAAGLVFLTGFFLDLVIRSLILHTTEAQAMGRDIPFSVDEFLIRPMLGNVGVITLFVLPLIGMQLSWNHRRSGFVELFPTSRFLEVIGTWLAAVMTYAFMLALVAIDFAMIVAWSHADINPLLTAFFGLLLLGACLLAIGTFVSTQVRNQVAQGAAMFTVCLMMWLADLHLPGEWDAVLQKASAVSHVQWLLKGVIDSKDIIYFVSVIGLFLLLAARSLRGRDYRVGWSRPQRAHAAASATFFGVGLLVVAGGANSIATQHNRSVDTTSHKVYTLSDQTVKVVKNLSTDVRIRYWNQETEFARARDVLDRYELLSPRIHVEYVDPLRNPARARADGVRSPDQLVVEVRGRTLRVDSLSERSLTASLVRMSQPDRGVCVFGPVGRRPEQFAQAVERISQVTMLDVGSLEDGELPAACSVIAVSNGDREYSENAVAACKRHVERGGRLLALLGTPFALGGPPAPEQKSLDRLLAGWGILPGRDLILDTGSMNSVLNFGPSVVLITKVGPHAVFDGLENVALAFPLSRSLQVTKGAESVLATGPDTVAVNEVKGAEVTIGPGNSKPGPFTVAAAVTVEGTEHRGRVLVVGSSDWFGPQLRSMGNQTLLVNIVEWLSLDQEVPDIPPKRIENRPLQLTAYQTKCLNWVSLWVLPLACAVAGTGVWWRTRPRP